MMSGNELWERIRGQGERMGSIPPSMMEELFLFLHLPRPAHVASFDDFKEAWRPMAGEGRQKALESALIAMVGRNGPPPPSQQSPPPSAASSTISDEYRVRRRERLGHRHEAIRAASASSKGGDRGELSEIAGSQLLEKERAKDRALEWRGIRLL